MKLLQEKTIRNEILKLMLKTGRGHLGGALSSVEILITLYSYFLNHNKSNYNENNRHRLIFSKGHSCMSLYAILMLKELISKKDFYNAFTLNSLLGGHPEKHIPGVEIATGSLGHGLSIAAGIAKGYKLKKIVKKIFVILGDGELNEGSIWEAALYASKHQLDNLYVIVDYNSIQSSGNNKNICDLEPLVKKWKSFNFYVENTNGHKIFNIREKLIFLSKLKNKPKILICKTVKGKGLKIAENNALWHYKRLNENEKNYIRSKLKL